jgi:hypothetical protein
MMTLRKKIFIITGVSVGFILAIVLLLFFLAKNRENPNNGFFGLGKQTQEEPTNQAPETITEKEPKNVAIEGEVQVKQEPGKVYVKQLAGIFVERFYSYSNQNDNSHIEDATAMATDKMSKWIVTQEVEQGFEYEGLTTEILSSEIERYTPDGARVLVGVQQTNSSGGATYKEAKIDLVNLNGDWKIDRITWLE